jgi:hypothetical protein
MIYCTERVFNPTCLSKFTLCVFILTLLIGSPVHAVKGKSRFSPKYQTDKHYKYYTGVAISSKLTSEQFDNLVTHGVASLEDDNAKKSNRVPSNRRVSIKIEYSQSPRERSGPSRRTRRVRYKQGPSFRQMALKVKKQSRVAQRPNRFAL